MSIENVKIQLISDPITLFEQETRRYTFLNLVQQVGKDTNANLPDTFIITNEDIGHDGDNVINYIVKYKFRYGTGLAKINTTKRTDWESGKWSSRLTERIWMRKDTLSETKHIYIIESFQALTPWFDGEEVNFTEFVTSQLVVH
jgi:hypothetical protein